MRCLQGGFTMPYFSFIGYRNDAESVSEGERESEGERCRKRESALAREREAE
jgi:hypothetical protein